MRNWVDQRSSDKRAQWWSSEKIRTDRQGFETAVKRATSSHHKVALEVTVRATVPPAMLDGAYGTAATASRERGGGAITTHFSVRSYFCFHHRVTQGTRSTVTAEHYGTLNFEAIYSGLFLEQQAASAYSEMFSAAVGPSIHT